MKKIALLFVAVATAGALQSYTFKNENRTLSKPAPVATADKMFADKAAVAGMAEVSLGKMAETKADSKEVKDFGSMMVMDHSKANAELMQIAKNKGITLPAGLDAEHKEKKEMLSKLHGASFDKAYVQAMVDGHKKVLALMQQEAANGQDPDLKAFAAKTAPVVQEHLTAITRIQASMK